MNTNKLSFKEQNAGMGEPWSPKGLPEPDFTSKESRIQKNVDRAHQRQISSGLSANLGGLFHDAVSILIANRQGSGGISPNDVRDLAEQLFYAKRELENKIIE